MTKRHALIILGILVAITPFTGIPDFGQAFIYVLAGLTIALLSYTRNNGSKIEEINTPQV